MAVSRVFISASVGASLVIATPFIADWEGKRNDPYNDIAGIRTVCYGETRVQMRRYSDAECLEMLEKAVGEFAHQVVKITPSLANRPIQLAAATSLAYNIGIGAYKNSTVARQFNAGNYLAACESFKAWRMVTKNGKKVVSQGLVNRRMAEYKLCVTYV